MKVLLVFAHPEPRSLNGALRDVAIRELEAQGHEVLISDLYADGWKSEVDRADFPSWPPEQRFLPAGASKKAFATNTLTEDVKAEIDKLLWADTLILQFPLWWYAMPAILKGWVDRVYAYGFAYGVGEHSDKRWGDRFGDGTLAGKRAMLIVTAGGWEEHYSARGVNGPIDNLLFPINHGILRRASAFRRLQSGSFWRGRFRACRGAAARKDADARDNPTDSLSAAEWRRLPHPEHAAPL